MDAARFPGLFAPGYADYANADLSFAVGPVDPERVSRLHLVATDGAGNVVVCRSREEWRFLPGGTREPGESLDALAARELGEEAGAELRGPLCVFAAQRAVSHNAAPFRPHLPHPQAAWAYAAAAVEVVGPPHNPADGETVVEVLALPPFDAARWLRVHDAAHAGVVLLAVELGLVRAG